MNTFLNTMQNAIALKNAIPADEQGAVEVALQNAGHYAEIGANGMALFWAKEALDRAKAAQPKPAAKPAPVQAEKRQSRPAPWRGFYVPDHTVAQNLASDVLQFMERRQTA